MQSGKDANWTLLDAYVEVKKERNKLKKKQTNKQKTNRKLSRKEELDAFKNS